MSTQPRSQRSARLRLRSGYARAAVCRPCVSPRSAYLPYSYPATVLIHPGRWLCASSSASLVGTVS
eukprot:874822-Pyramimonas_sp.AAC.1